MIQTSDFIVGEKNLKIVAKVNFCGDDIVVVIGGGERPHIGAVALAQPRESLRKDGRLSATASVLCLMGHKEDQAARDAAIFLASQFNKIVLVSVGLHIDDADTEQIENLENNFKVVLEEIVSKYCK